MRLSRLLLLACISAGISLAVAADSIPLRELPEPVVQAIDERFKGASLISAERDERNDYVYYFVELKHEGVNRRVEINEYGKFVEESAVAP